jgi:uncharacterized protein YecE (DUF72 family)
MDKINDNIFIGTSGYKHPDWLGNVYPPHLKPIDYLSYYIEQLDLNFLELTFTFHKIPYRKTIEQIVEHIKKSMKPFRISIKLYKSLLRTKFEKSVLDEFLAGLFPFIKENIPFCFLADYPNEFTVSKENLSTLVSLRHFLEKYELFVSFPHRSWYKERFLEILRTNKIGLVIQYIPDFVKKITPYVIIATNGYAYFRVHSNATFYLPTANNKTLYNYSAGNIEDIAKDVAKISIITKETYVAFCNVKNGLAAFNAMLLKKTMEKR